MKALRAGGNVLLPVETAGRVLELVLYLDKVRLNPSMYLKKCCDQFENI